MFCVDQVQELTVLMPSGSGGSVSGWAHNNAFSSGTTLVAANDSDGKLGDYDMLLNKPLGTPITLTASSGSVLPCFIDATHVACLSNRMWYVDLTARTQTNLNAIGASGSGFPIQQLAGIPSAGQVIGLSTTQNVLCRWNGATMSVLTVSGSLYSYRCVIAKPGATRWIIGADGVSGTKIFEVDFAGTIQNTITPATFPGDTGAVSMGRIFSMAISGDNLLLSTISGVIYHLQYSTGTLLNQYYLGQPVGGNEGLVLSEAANGIVAVTPYGNNTDTTLGHPIAIFDMTSNPICIMDAMTINSKNNLKCTALGMIPSLGRMYLGDWLGKLFFIPMKGLTTQSVDTKSQDPAGIDVAANIIRIRKNPSGLLKVESAQSVSAGNAPVTANHHGYEYYEIAVKGTPGVNEKYDARKFEA
jgi:hypothetical protein